MLKTVLAKSKLAIIKACFFFFFFLMLLTGLKDRFQMLSDP